uniref:UDP-N-acetylglucosamine 2-epimerase (non-hydrolyzing) n=1 Tax=Candidatus Kentrum sp. MB TaxID=2138164 RepID=A0A451B787_9GAMM|nr:MAG: UDP-N-acetylglucosamine 2-epimerase (non-hydrolysing) [Candidatus Kentron sp. MB]VFK74153.1 MAG: UDP-N-acetylglucosamine 2-epimerase (non-hydrolysing) [Candidatus Kentron sp. MB]
MIRALLILGTRPEAIKMAPVLWALENHPDFTPLVCLTGQHREQLQPFLDLFRIQADANLEVMTENQTLTELTARILPGIDQQISGLQPDVVLVQGDTTTTFCGALAAFYRRIPVAHIEAGLRTGDPYNPFPEEMNRRMTSHLATWHFPPTEVAARALRQEGIVGEDTLTTGNTAIDTLLWVIERLQGGHLTIDPEHPIHGFKRRFLLVTGHRRENFGDGFLAICQALKAIAIAHPELDLVYPVHLNPNVHLPVRRLLRGVDNIHLLPPLPYVPFVSLMHRCHFILTDSGGVQEEALSLDKPVLILRTNTERTEALESGGALLVGAVPETIIGETERLLADQQHYRRMAMAGNPFGDGMAARRIVDFLARRMTLI